MKNKPVYYCVATCEDATPVAVYRNLPALHRDLRRYNKIAGFPFLRFKDMEIYTGEDDTTPVYTVSCIRNDLFWQPCHERK